MNPQLEKYFIPNEKASYKASNGKQHLVAAITYKGIKTERAEEAKKQSDLPAVSIEQTISYVNEFLDAIKGASTNRFKFNEIENEIELDDKIHKIVGNCIIVKDCEWKETKWNDPYDKKYDVIKDKFGLKNVWDLVWLKFSIKPNSNQRYLGVVALGNDINYSYSLSAGKLIKEVGHKWDESFVCIFPLTKEICRYKNRRQIETGVGNYLIDRSVPIIDFYSHNNFE